MTEKLQKSNPVAAVGVRSDRLDTITRNAGLIVTILMAIMVSLIILILHLHLDNVSALPESDFSTSHGFECQTSECYVEQAKLYLENDAQLFRTDRVKAAISYRLMIYVIAEIVALILIVLGGVLIFDRVMQAGEKATLKTDKWWVTVGTSFPGVILCLFGTVTLGLAMWLPTTKGSTLQVFDVPVFIEDQNSLRTTLGLRSGSGPAGTEAVDLTGIVDGFNVQDPNPTSEDPL